MGFLRIGISDPIRHYYQVRNTLLLFKRDYTPNYWKYSGLVKIIFKLVVYPIILDHGYERFRYILLGIKDGLLGKVENLNKNINSKIYQFHIFSNIIKTMNLLY